MISIIFMKYHLWINSAELSLVVLEEFNCLEKKVKQFIKVAYINIHKYSSNQNRIILLKYIDYWNTYLAPGTSDNQAPWFPQMRTFCMPCFAPQRNRNPDHDNNHHNQDHNPYTKVDRCLARYSPRAEANNVIPCNTVRYNTIPCNKILYNMKTMRYHTRYKIQSNSMQYHMVPCNQKSDFCFFGQKWALVTPLELA